MATQNSLKTQLEDKEVKYGIEACFALILVHI